MAKDGVRAARDAWIKPSTVALVLEEGGIFGEKVRGYAGESTTHGATGVGVQGRDELVRDMKGIGGAMIQLRVFYTSFMG